MPYTPIPFRPRRMAAAVAAVAIVGGFCAWRAAWSADPAPPAPGVAPAAKPADPEEQAIHKAIADYLEAYRKGDLEAVMALWAPDADYVQDNGAVTRGREAIGALFKSSFKDLKGHTLRFPSRSLKFVRPDVAVEDGTVEIAAPSGDAERSRFTSIWVKSGGKWLLSSVRDLPAEPAPAKSAASARLAQLEWMIGDWVDDEPNVDVVMSVRWAENKSFLIKEFKVARGDSDPLTVTQRIGWDPSAGKLRTWTFDSLGGFNEGLLARDGNKWVGTVEGVLPDGRTASSVNEIRFVNENAYVWRSHDRQVDGHPLPDSQVKFVRKAKAKDH